MERGFNRISTKKPNVYLMTSMSDFSDWKAEWKQRVFDKMKDNPQHEYLFLTKSPEKAAFTCDMQNVWMGVTVTSKKDMCRIGDLKKHMKFNNYFITFEPLFEDVGMLDLRDIGWIVIGTETGNRRGKITAEKEWVLRIVKQADRPHIPVFMKSTMASIVGEKDLRQEIPESFNRPKAGLHKFP
jgi:protein gp37